MKKNALAIAVVAVLPLGVSAGYVQAAEASGGGLEEIIVTAQKREENLQDTPISLTALSEHKLEVLGVRDIVDLSKHTPNLQIYATPGDKVGATINIRGMVTSSPQITYEPAVGMYVDGLFVAKASANILELVDVERIEVLRGPQGTLYGRNTIGGAINIINALPTGELGGKLSVGAGNLGAKTIQAKLNLPGLGDVGEGAGKLSSKLSFSRRERDSLFDNVASDNAFRNATPYRSPSDGLEDEESQGYRIDLLWDLTESFNVRYFYENHELREETQNFQLTDITRCGLWDRECPTPDPLAGLINLADFSSKKKLKDASRDGANRSNVDVEAHGVIVGWDFGEVGFLGDVSTKFLWSNRQLDWSVGLDLDGSDIDLATFDTEYEYEQDTYELQLSGKTETLDYVVGVYYFEESGFVDAIQRFFGVFSPGAPGDIIDQYGINKDTAEAVFGQVTWVPGFAVLDNRLSLTIGGRYTEEDKDLSRYRVNAGATDPVVDIPSAEVSYNNFSKMFSVGWELDQDINVYAKYAEGYKAGGLTSQAGSPEAFIDGFEPEEVETIEVGMKSRWLDNRLQVNLAAFWSDYNDLQVTIFKQIPAGDSFVLGTVIDNAGTAEISGLELEVESQLTDNLYLSATYAYLDPDYIEYLNNVDVGGGAVVEVDIKDQKSFSYTPKHAGSLNMEYRIPNTKVGDWALWVNWSYRGRIYGSAAKSDSEIFAGRSLTDARITLDNIPLVSNGQLSMAFWGKNIFDKEYPVSSIDFGGFGYTGWSWGDERTFGIDVSYSF